jgi:hypothetical protein
MFFTSSPGLQPFAPNIWIADGPNVRDMGFIFSTRMTIVKLSDGCLWVESPVPVSFEMLNQIVALGPIQYLVAATPRHVWRLEQWHGLFPAAQLWVARPTLLTLEKAHLSYTGIIGDEPPQAWANDLDQHLFKGNPLSSEVFFFHEKARTLMLDDLLQIHTTTPGKPFRNLLIKLEGVLSPYGGVGLDIRLAFTNRHLARQSLEKVLGWDFDKLIIAHGPCIAKDAKPFVERAFRWLMR